MSKTRTVTFGTACTGCPMLERCGTTQSGPSMSIHPHEGLLAPPHPGPHPAFKQA